MKKELGKRLFDLFGTMLVFVALFSCTDEKNTEQSQDLFGVWYNTSDANPNGRYLEQLTINQDSTFVYEQSSYGIYVGQTENDLSASIKHEGRFTIDSNNLNSDVTRTILWDSFTQLADTSTQSITLFEDCKFVRVGNSLKLTYTTYPADAPEITTKNFYKPDL